MKYMLRAEEIVHQRRLRKIGRKQERIGEETYEGHFEWFRGLFWWKETRPRVSIAEQIKSMGGEELDAALQTVIDYDRRQASPSSAENLHWWNPAHWGRLVRRDQVRRRERRVVERTRKVCLLSLSERLVSGSSHCTARVADKYVLSFWGILEKSQYAEEWTSTLRIEQEYKDEAYKADQRKKIILKEIAASRERSEQHEVLMRESLQRTERSLRETGESLDRVETGLKQVAQALPGLAEGYREIAREQQELRDGFEEVRAEQALAHLGIFAAPHVGNGTQHPRNGGGLSGGLGAG